MYIKIKDDNISEKTFISNCKAILRYHNAYEWIEYLDRIKAAKYERRVKAIEGGGHISDKNTLHNGKRHYIAFLQDKYSVRRHIIFRYDKSTRHGYFFLYDIELIL